MHGSELPHSNYLYSSQSHHQPSLQLAHSTSSSTPAHTTRQVRPPIGHASTSATTVHIPSSSSSRSDIKFDPSAISTSTSSSSVSTRKSNSTTSNTSPPSTSTHHPPQQQPHPPPMATLDLSSDSQSASRMIYDPYSSSGSIPSRYSIPRAGGIQYAPGSVPGTYYATPASPSPYYALPPGYGNGSGGPTDFSPSASPGMDTNVIDYSDPYYNPYASAPPTNSISMSRGMQGGPGSNNGGAYSGGSVSNGNLNMGYVGGRGGGSGGGVYAQGNPNYLPTMDSSTSYPASPERPHQCDLCALSFNRPYDLKRHRISHFPEKPHECPYCGKKYSRKDALHRHQLSKQCGRSD